MKRLSEVAKQNNTGLSNIAKYLQSIGYSVEINPNTKLTEEQVELVNQAYKPINGQVKEDLPTKTLLNPFVNPELAPVETSFNMQTPIQKILFGSPGTGKSHAVEEVFLKKLGIDKNGENCVKTVFHPEYTYGDFMGKLMPLSDDEGNVSYRYYEGHFLSALSKAYKALSSKDVNKTNAVLVIDEINRGNSASIFGSAFQLLDRDESGWSNYAIRISSMEMDTLIRLVYNDELEGLTQKARSKKIFKLIEDTDLAFLGRQEIKLPPNLSIIGTMNTSDNSIYYMDSAFKRRWDWEFISVNNNRDKAKFSRMNVSVTRILETTKVEWVIFIDLLNEFLKFNHGQIRKVEDKQVGYYFIKDDVISDEKIRNKLMFFLWDSVFSTNKKPLSDLLKIPQSELVTFGDFASRSVAFCNAIAENSWKRNV